MSTHTAKITFGETDNEHNKKFYAEREHIRATALAHPENSAMMDNTDAAGYPVFRPKQKRKPMYSASQNRKYVWPRPDNWHKAPQIKHNKDCELGENHKDCPACNPEHEHSKGESRVKANAHAVSVHTPLPWELSHELGDGFSVAREVAPNCGKLIVIANAYYSDSKYQPTRDEAKANAEYIIKACNDYPALLADQSKTAAERDSLRKQLNDSLRANVDYLNRMQEAREQVKMLLLACERVGNKGLWRNLNGELTWRGETPDGNELETEHPVSILQAAIKSVESEGQ